MFIKITKKKLALTFLLAIFIKDIVNNNNFNLPTFGSFTVSPGVKSNYIQRRSKNSKPSTIVQQIYYVVRIILIFCLAILTTYFLKIKNDIEEQILILWVITATFVYLAIEFKVSNLNFLYLTIPIHSILELSLLYINRKKAFGNKINFMLIEFLILFQIFIKQIFKPVMSIYITNFLAIFSDSILAFYTFFLYKSIDKFIWIGIMFHCIIASLGELANFIDSISLKFRNIKTLPSGIFISIFAKIGFTISHLSFTIYAAKQLTKITLFNTIAITSTAFLITWLINFALKVHFDKK